MWQHNSRTNDTTKKDDDPINYYCPVCDIERETGLNESTSEDEYNHFCSVLCL